MPFHISPETGNPGACKAKPGNCPFGSVHEHYESKEDARAAYERSQESFAAAQLIKLDSEGYIASKYVDRMPLYGMACSICGEAYTIKSLYAGEDDEAVCSKGHTTFVSEQTVTMTPENPSAKFMDKQAVKDAVWYHSTQDPDWLQSFEDEEGVEVHLGVEDAAFDRALYANAGVNRSTSPEDFYVYEVKLDDSAEINDGVAPNNYEVDWQNHKRWDDENDRRGDDVMRYYNVCEAPGSISLLANAKKLKIVGMRKVTVEEARRRQSVMNINPSLRNEPVYDY